MSSSCCMKAVSFSVIIQNFKPLMSQRHFDEKHWIKSLIRELVHIGKYGYMCFKRISWNHTQKHNACPHRSLDGTVFLSSVADIAPHLHSPLPSSQEEILCSGSQRR